MSVTERLCLFGESLPRKCLYCRYGYPVVFGKSEWLDVFVCGARVFEVGRSKKAGPPIDDPDPSLAGKSAGKRAAAPLVDAWEGCSRFAPALPLGEGYVNRRKFELLDEFGMFDDMREARCPETR